MPEFNEKQLLADIEQLRAQFPQTQDLYREVCILLFFRYGVTPTTNKLYQLVRKGSMSAPAEALTRFWDDLRDKSRVRIEHPDLPETLKSAAGELVASLWSSAQGAAKEELTALRSEAQAQVAEARQAQEKAEMEREALRASHEVVSQTLEKAHMRVSELEQVEAAGKATISALESQLENARRENAGLLKKLEEARQDFALELEKLRAATSLAEERFRTSEMRALVEIDRERTATAKLHKELDSLRTAVEQSEARHRTEVAELQDRLGIYRQRIGELDGNLNALTVNRDLALDDLRQMRAQEEERNAKLSTLNREAAELRGQLEQARQTIDDLLRAAKPSSVSRRARKSTPSI